MLKDKISIWASVFFRCLLLFYFPVVSFAVWPIWLFAKRRSPVSFILVCNLQQCGLIGYLFCEVVERQNLKVELVVFSLSGCVLFSCCPFSCLTHLAVCERLCFRGEVDGNQLSFFIGFCELLQGDFVISVCFFCGDHVDLDSCEVVARQNLKVEQVVFFPCLLVF